MCLGKRRRKSSSKGGGDGGCRFHPAEEYQKHEDKTDHIRDISDTAHVCVDGTYDLQRAWRSDAAAYHEVFPWKRKCSHLRIYAIPAFTSDPVC